jgi:N-acetylmuramoyl-L-alanine amidase/Mannosyl-glycoprotein endo-beta-N-acetylglucosaminidase
LRDQTVICSVREEALTNPPITFSGLTDEEAHSTAKFHSDQGATVVVSPDGSGTFTVQITYPADGAGSGPSSGPISGGSASTAWLQLATSYKANQHVSDSLKVATLAQWALESGRGTSALSVQHLNFAGIKFRERMAGFATPVAYTGSDGETTSYCKFATLDAFVAGYWHFIETGPYTGWDRFTGDAAGFINFIAPNYAADPQYPQKVAALFSEARGLLGNPATGNQTGGVGTIMPAQPPWNELRAKFLNKRTGPIQGIVLHDTAGNGGHGDTVYLSNPGDGRPVSVDFTVEKDGSIWKLNPDLPSFYCNHAGRNTSWMGFKNKQVNAVSVGIEITQSSTLRGPPYYPADQVRAVGRLCAWLGAEFKFDNSRITTHRQIITDGSRSDPRKFPFDDFWAAYWEALGRGASFQTALTGHDVGDDSGAGDFGTATDES